MTEPNKTWVIEGGGCLILVIGIVLLFFGGWYTLIGLVLILMAAGRGRWKKT